MTATLYLAHERARAYAYGEHHWQQKRQDEQRADDQSRQTERQPTGVELVSHQHGVGECEQVVIRCARELSSEGGRKTVLDSPQDDLTLTIFMKSKHLRALGSHSVARPHGVGKARRAQLRAQPPQQVDPGVSTFKLGLCRMKLVG